MCSYLRMEIITELEEEFTARRGANRPTHISVKTISNNYSLDEAQVGPNFILGRSGNRVYFFPNSSITEVISLECRLTIEESLESLLANQRQPVKLLLFSGIDTQIAWLLNVEGNWIRVAGQGGVSWVPFARLLIAETDLVLADPKS
jgi:hypothetical protein